LHHEELYDIGNNNMLRTLPKIERIALYVDGGSEEEFSYFLMDLLQPSSQKITLGQDKNFQHRTFGRITS
jgi:hypothetical protein